MIKGVLLYDKESGVKLYYKYNNNDLLMSSNNLASFLSMIQKIQQSKNEKIKEKIKNLKYHQFQVSLENTIKITDNNKIHNNILFNQNNQYVGVFSASEGVTSKETNELFNLITNKIKINRYNNSLFEIDDESKNKVDNILNEYIKNNNENNYM